MGDESEGETDSTYTTTTRRSRAYTPTAVSLVSSLEKPLMIRIGDGKTQKILAWTFQQRSVCSTRSSSSKSHRSGAVAALEGPKDVTEHMVRFVCDMLETWGFGVCVLKCRNEPAEMALQNTVVRTRRFRETRPGIRMAVWVTVKQPSKSWRNRFVQRCFKCTLIATATVTSFLRSC